MHAPLGDGDDSSEEAAVAASGDAFNLVSELELIMGEAGAELLAEDEADDELQHAAANACERDETAKAVTEVPPPPASAASGCAGASSSDFTGPVSSEADLQRLLVSLDMVDFSTGTRMQFCDRERPTHVVLDICSVAWAAGGSSLKAVCRRRGHGPSGSCNVWFQNVTTEARRLELIAESCRWAAAGRKASEQQHWNAAHAVKIKNAVRS